MGARCWVGVFFFVLLVTIGLSYVSELPDHRDSLPDFGKLPIAEVVRVVDGDTVRLRSVDEAEERYRLVDVDTPELDEKYGEAAYHFLKNLLEGETVWVERYGIGQRGRSLVRLFRVPDGLFVDLEIIRQGYGKVHLEGQFDEKQLLMVYQEHAKEKLKGIWADAPEPDRKIEPDGKVYVFIASSGKGKKYHKTAECYHIRDDKIKISLDEAKRQGLEPCKTCKPE